MKSNKPATKAFTLVEVTLAIAVVAIGLVGILVLFPLGLRSTRDAAFRTDAALIAEEYISRYQQAALDSNNYENAGSPATLLADTNYVISTTNLNGFVYKIAVTVTNNGFPVIMTSTNAGASNTISRVELSIYEEGRTNAAMFYATEVARYVTP